MVSQRYEKKNTATSGDFLFIYFFLIEAAGGMHDESKNMSSRADSAAWPLLGTGGGSFQEDVS